MGFLVTEQYPHFAESSRQVREKSIETETMEFSLLSILKQRFRHIRRHVFKVKLTASLVLWLPGDYGSWGLCGETSTVI